MEATRIVVSTEAIADEAAEAMEWIDTRAAASAIMERMEERAAALAQLRGIDRDGERYLVERETRKCHVAFTVLDRMTGDVIAKAWAEALIGESGAWQVVCASIDNPADGAVATAVCLLLAASVAAEKTRA